MLTRFLDNMDIIAALDDEPNDVGGLTAAELKAKFDQGGKALQTYINETLIPQLDGDAATPHSHANKAALDIISAVTSVMGTSDTAVPTERAVSDALMGLDHGQMFAHTHDVTDIVSGALPVVRGGTGCDGVDEEPAEGSLRMVKSGGVYSAIAALAKVACGSYVGTGVSGPDNPNSLTFDFAPKVLWIIAVSDTESGRTGYIHDWFKASYGGSHIMMCDKLTAEYGAGNAPVSENYINMAQHMRSKKSADGKTVSWYFNSTAGSADNARYQHNTSGVTYYYMIIG